MSTTAVGISRREARMWGESSLGSEDRPRPRGAELSQSLCVLRRALRLSTPASLLSALNLYKMRDWVSLGKSTRPKKELSYAQVRGGDGGARSTRLIVALLVHTTTTPNYQLDKGFGVVRVCCAYRLIAAHMWVRRLTDLPKWPG